MVDCDLEDIKSSLPKAIKTVPWLNNR